MFDDHNTDFDLMMKSVLEGGQEEVPAHIWDGVSSSLDKMARRKKVLVIFRRCATVTAVAACLALGLFLGNRHNSSDILDPTPNNPQMLAVVPAADSSDNIQNIELVAEAKRPSVYTQETVITNASDAIEVSDYDQYKIEKQVVTEQTVAEPVVSETTTTEATPSKPTTNNKSKDEEDIRFPDSWDEQEDGKDKVRTSIVLSGLAATNNSQNKKGHNIMKRPTLANGKETTGITDNSTNSTFGIPLSFGLAAKFEFTPRWAISAGARYTLLTRKFYGTYTKVDESGMVELTESSNIRNSQHYIGIPVNVYFNIVNRDYLKFYAYAGGSVEKCVIDNYQILSSRRTHIEKVKGVQWSADAGFGVEFAAGKHVGIYIDPSLRYYFRNDNQPKSLRTVKPLMLGFEAGVRINL